MKLAPLAIGAALLASASASAAASAAADASYADWLKEIRIARKRQSEKLLALMAAAPVGEGVAA